MVHEWSIAFHKTLYFSLPSLIIDNNIAASFKKLLHSLAVLLFFSNDVFSLRYKKGVVKHLSPVLCICKLSDKERLPAEIAITAINNLHCQTDTVCIAVHIMQLLRFA